MQTSSFTTHPSPHEVTTSLEVENSVGIKNLSLGKKYEMGICLQLCRFSSLSWPLGSGRESFVPRIRLDEEGLRKSHPGGYEQNTQSTVLWRGLRPALQRLLSHWPLVMSCLCLQGPGNAPWLMECLTCEYTFLLRGAATSRISRPGRQN